MRFSTRLDPQHIPDLFKLFTKPHPRYKVFRNKSLGAALINLRSFADAQHYFASVNQKGYAGHKRRKARSRGYRLCEITRDAYAEQIHAINISSEMRQGRPMDPSYRVRQAQFDVRASDRCFGVMNASGELVAYCYLGILGNFAAIHQLMGYKGHDGVMYFMLAEIIALLITEGSMEFFMYDLMLGGSAGLRDFKRRVGFAPYRAKFSLHE
ncbi:MAG: hypothetical protein V4484_18495 [Pseudomonadota bacterium]